MNCYKCPSPLTNENKTKEHIVPNFLGGKLTSENLICKKCNTEFGETIDAELHKQLGFAAEIIVHNRDRKKEDKGILVETISGKKAKVGLKFIPKPKLYIKIPGTEKQIEIIGKNEKELKKLALKKKKELEAKYGEFKLTEFIEYPNSEKFHFKNNSKVQTGIMEFGGTDYFRGIGKIILNFYLTKRPNDKMPKRLMDFVCGLVNKNQFLFTYHPSHYKIHELQENEFSHIIYLRGESEIKSIYCYLEIFNFEKFICIIDDNYTGEDFEETYCLDSLYGKQIKKEIRIKLYRHNIEDMLFVTLGHKTQREWTFNEFEKRIERLQER